MEDIMASLADPRTQLISDDWRIDGRVYRDPLVFEREMNTIFARSWIFVAHESEIADAGDYKLAHIGRQPVIVNRSADTGEINVIFNRCRHRGSAVCQRETGSANFFRCAYHGWTYSSDGDLIGVPFADGYPADFDKSAMGLVHVPRVGTYKGFVFASLDPDAPPLDEFIGHAKPYLDFIAGLGDDGIELSSHAHKVVYRGNWKLQVENTIDPYHFSFTHKSWLDILKDRSGKPSTWVQNVTGNVDWRGVDLEGGHSVHEYGRLADRDKSHGVGIGDLLPFNFILFPTLSFVGAHLRLVVPRGVDETAVLLYPILPKGADEETRSAILRNHEGFYGPAGAGSTDDIEVAFERVTSGLAADATSEDWILMNRGIERETLDEETGLRVGRSSDEVPQRGFYRRWKELLGDGDGN
jgi:phenylpropionate dioxygenase-like ring-hydroxylating dioxygenase large terminal subunit